MSLLKYIKGSPLTQYFLKPSRLITLATMVSLATMALLLHQQGIYSFSPDHIQQTFDNLGYKGPILFILLYMLITATLIPASPLSLSAGVLFGSGLGFIYTLLGATGGSILAFIIARYLAADSVNNLLDRKFPRLKFAASKISQNGFIVTVIVRLVPIIPFNISNYLLGTTRISLADYILGTLVSIAPGVFVFVFLGGSIAAKDMSQIFLALTFLFLLTCGGYLLAHRTNLLQKIDTHS